MDMDDKEFRDGYEINPKQKKIWNVELDLLKIFLEVCGKYDIQVQVFAGTLLGAVRHKGFIPWDDDADVCMDRANFNRLLKLPRDAFPAPYFLQTPYNDQRFYTPFVRFRNSETTGIIRWNNSPDYNNGIYIDVFVLDGKPYGCLERIHAILLANSKALISRKQNLLMKTQQDAHRNARSLRGILAEVLCRVLSLDSLIRIHQFVMGLFTPLTRRVTLISHPKSFSDKYWMFKQELKDTVELEFEGFRVPAPQNYDAILTRIYGDYMKFPPASERGKWHEDMIYFDPDRPYKETYARGFKWFLQ